MQSGELAPRSPRSNDCALPPEAIVRHETRGLISQDVLGNPQNTSGPCDGMEQKNPPYGQIGAQQLAVLVPHSPFIAANVTCGQGTRQFFGFMPDVTVQELCRQ